MIDGPCEDPWTLCNDCVITHSISSEPEKNMRLNIRPETLSLSRT